MSHRRRNRSDLREGRARRASDCLGRNGGRGDRSALLPAVPGNPQRSGPLDGQTLAAELVARAKRGWST